MPSGTACRILVVEDEILIAMDMEHMLEDAGYGVMGAFSNVADSLRALDKEDKPAAAILDVQLDGEDVFPVADRLGELGVPIVFHSGHAEPAKLAEQYPDARFCVKPCTPNILTAEVEAAIAGVSAEREAAE
ncbi:response regulator [Sphingomicrobium sediminis]|uniref:Response regulator n=1 Tax=Sphingomicrobium sediminis TaxID=2950949 RepID=A0A9X2EHZ7_9SPHN|nr:response regulator [Sphingomicrobium sediminis]MCM8558373.1 response regulator [Sphingomicrobium sediminis]